MRHPFLRTLAGSAATPTDPNFENVTLLLHGDGTNGGQNNTFVDGSTNNFTITRNGNTTQGTFSPYGDNWSNYFDGTGDYLSTSISNNVIPTTGDFTVELWIHPTGQALGEIFAFRTTAPSAYSAVRLLRETDGASISLFVSTNGSSHAINAGFSTLPISTWTHLAVVRNGGTFEVFRNGTSVYTSTAVSSGTALMTGSFNYIGALNTGSVGRFITGYLSNLRVTQSAVYTANFTPPTAPLTAITNTSLLTCQSNRFRDASTNNFTITRNGDVSVQRFSPFSPTAAYAAGTIGGSGYFDGTGDWVQAADNAAFTLGTSDFTIEAWVYTTTAGTLRIAGQSDSAGNNSTISAWIAKRSDETAVGVVCSGSTEYLVSTTTAIRLGQWNHVVMTRDGNTLRMYVNGVQGGTLSITGVTVNDSSRPLAVGRLGDITGSPWNGYISDYRLVVGTCVYPSGTTFTPPTAPLTAITNTSLLLNFQNAAILDNAMMAVPETVGNAQIDTTIKKYGTGSLEFDGTGDWLLVPDSIDQRLGTGNFTIECWLYLSATGTARGIVGKGTSTTGWLLSTNTSNAVVFTYGTSTITSTGTLSGTTWYHIAVVREGTSTNQTKIYIGGTNDGTGTVSTDFNQTNAAYVGANRTGGDPMNGFIDDLRITKGVARYTATFTPPTAAFPDL